MKQTNSEPVVSVTRDQLPMHCPLPDAPLLLWYQVSTGKRRKQSVSVKKLIHTATHAAGTRTDCCAW